MLFYASLSGFSLVITTLLMRRGAWLVVSFTGIELLAVDVAFAVYARHAVEYESIRLFPHRFMIERVATRTALTQIEFNLHWVRVEGAPPHDPIWLVSRE